MFQFCWRHCSQVDLLNKYLLITGYVPAIRRLPCGTRRWKKPGCVTVRSFIGLCRGKMRLYFLKYICICYYFTG